MQKCPTDTWVAIELYIVSNLRTVGLDKRYQRVVPAIRLLLNKI